MIRYSIKLKNDNIKNWIYYIKEKRVAYQNRLYYNKIFIFLSIICGNL